MKYKVFISDSIEFLHNEQLIGSAENYQEACRVITEYLTANNLYHDPYWRIILDQTATFIDYSSWSRFAVIVPPVSMKELAGEE